MIKNYRYVGDNVDGMFTKGKTYEFETNGEYFINDDDGDIHYWDGISEDSEFELVDSAQELETELRYPKVERKETFIIEDRNDFLELTRKEAEQLHKKLGELLSC